MKQRVGLIGLGLMGAPMGRNWLNKGFQLTILPHKNKNPAIELQSLGARIAPNLEALVKESEVIVLMVPSSKEVESICVGPKGLINYLTKTQLVIDMSTSVPDSTRRIHNIYLKKGLRFFDAPVTGGVKGAGLGTLTLFIGGPVDWHEEVRELLGAVSQTQSHFGDAGMGHVAKIINNFICIGNLQVFSEALPLAAKLGLDPQRIFETLLSGTASSEMLKIYGPQILVGDFNPRFKLSHAFKDMKIAQDLVRKLKVKLPLLEGMLTNFKMAIKDKVDKENFSALIKPFEKKFRIKFRS